MTYHANIISVYICLTVFAFSFYVSLHSHFHRNQDINVAYIIYLSTYKYLKHYYITRVSILLSIWALSLVLFYFFLLYHHV